MTTELTILAFSVGLGFLQLFAAAASSTKLRGTKWNLSSRDETPAPLTGKTARIDRAFQNFKETFPFFLAAVALVSITGRGGNLSEVGSIVYLAARLIYIPLYVFNVIFVRSLIWLASVLGIIAILLQAFI